MALKLSKMEFLQLVAFLSFAIYFSKYNLNQIKTIIILLKNDTFDKKTFYFKKTQYGG